MPTRTLAAVGSPGRNQCSHPPRDEPSPGQPNHPWYPNNSLPAIVSRSTAAVSFLEGSGFVDGAIGGRVVAMPHKRFQHLPARRQWQPLQRGSEIQSYDRRKISLRHRREAREQIVQVRSIAVQSQLYGPCANIRVKVIEQGRDHIVRQSPGRMQGPHRPQLPLRFRRIRRTEHCRPIADRGRALGAATAGRREVSPARMGKRLIR